MATVVFAALLTLGSGFWQEEGVYPVNATAAIKPWYRTPEEKEIAVRLGYRDL